MLTKDGTAYSAAGFFELRRDRYGKSQAEGDGNPPFLHHDQEVW
jgi:hypothetical protein